MPVEFKLSGNGFDTTVVLMDTLADQTFYVHVSVLPTEGELDPDNWILKTATLVSVVDEGVHVAPQAFRLSQNYPNPFNPTTAIDVALPKSRHATLKVFDLLGREVVTLVDENLPAGIHRADWNADGFSSGVYVYRLQTRDFVQTKKLMLLR